MSWSFDEFLNILLEFNDCVSDFLKRFNMRLGEWGKWEENELKKEGSDVILMINIED